MNPSALNEHAANWAIALDGLTEQQRLHVVQAMRRTAYGPRDQLFRQGEPSTQLLVVERGVVRVFHVAASGNQFTCSVASTGAMLGIIAVVLNKPHFLCAEAVDRVSVASLSRGCLLDLMERIPRLASNLHQVLASLAMESALRNSSAIDSTAVRLGKVLRELATRIGVPVAGSALAIRGLTHQDIATMIGASRTWVTLTLGSFESHGVLTRKKNMLIIRSLARLDQFVAAHEQGSVQSLAERRGDARFAFREQAALGT